MAPAISHLAKTVYRHHILRCILPLLFVLLPSVSLWFGQSSTAQAPSVTMNKSASPIQVPSRGRVTYTITLVNEGLQAARDVGVADFLPAGFSYVRGSSKVYSNSALISTTDPIIMGQMLFWRYFTLPAARQGSYYGIHTFIQERCNSDDINYQLDRALELMGPGAYVKQLFHWITPETRGPLPCWVDFVNRAYDRGLVPVVRLQGVHGGPYWLKPEPDAPGDYTTIAEAYKRVVQGLPRRDGHRLYVEIWNEPNLDIEWGGQPNPIEYGHFLVDVAAAIRSLGDPRVVILNGALAPGGNYNNLAFIDALATVPGALNAFDVWAAHPYPGNHPPEYNIHDNTAVYRDLTIDSFLPELERLAAHGRTGLQVLLTETGYALGQNNFGFEGYPPISEGNRADYIRRAYRDYWRRWPEVLGVCPYELVDPRGDWWVWDWLYPDGRHHEQYDAVAALPKEAPLVASRLTIIFQATAAEAGGVYYNQVDATSSNATILSLRDVAPVTVLAPVATRTPTQTATATPTLSGTPPTPTATPLCPEQLTNGDFESSTGWTLSRAEYTTTPVHTGQRALRLGIVDGINVYSFSSAMQGVSLPADASRATLSFWYYPISGDTLNDLQMVRLYENGVLLASLMREPSNARQWLWREYDLSPYLGRTIQLYFGVRNDGQGGSTAMYLDDVSVTTCGAAWLSPTPTHTPTRSATPSPTPTTTPAWTSTPTPTVGVTRRPTCAELVSNPGFEDDAAWEIPDTAHPAQYSEGRAHMGRRSMLLGIPEGENIRSYSSARQLLTLPADATRITFSFWYFPISDDGAHDRQYVLILDEQNVYLETVMWFGSNQGVWLSRAHSLDQYAGRRIKIHFGVYNDGQGGSTAMYVDDVSIRACWGVQHISLPLILKNPDAGFVVTASAVPDATERLKSLLQTDMRTILAQDSSLAGFGEAAQGSAPWSLPIKRTPGPADTSRLALNARTRRLYVAWGGRLLVLNADDGALLASLPIASRVHGLAVDEERDRVYISERENEQLWVLDGATNRVLARVKGIPQPGGVATIGDRVYITATGSDELLVLDSETFEVLERVPVGRAPYAVAADPAARCILVANAGEASITAIDRFDTQAKSVVSLSGLGHPQSIATHSASAEFYVTYAISPKHHAIAVIDGNKPAVTRTLQGTARQPLVGAYGVVVHPAGERLYVADGAVLCVLDSRSGQIMARLPVDGAAYALEMAVDAFTRRVYIVDARQAKITVRQD